MKNLVVLFILILTNPLFAQDPPEKYQKLWAQVNEGNSDAAIKELRKIAKKEKNDPWPYWMLGIALYAGNHTPEIQECFKKSIEADSTFAPAHYNYAQTLDSSQMDLCIHHYTKAISFDSTENHYYVARAGTYLELKKYDLAISDCEKSKQLYPEDFYNIYSANSIILESLYEQGNLEGLKTFLERNDPNQGGGGMEDPFHHYLLGKIYESLNDHFNACMEYSQAIVDQESLKEMFEDPDLENPDWYDSVVTKLKTCK